MTAELIKEKENYTYRIKSNKKVVLKSRFYKRKMSAVRGFIRFNNSVKYGRMVVYNNDNSYRVEIKNTTNKVIAESVNLYSTSRVNIFKEDLHRNALILEDKETNKMKTYIQNIGDIQLKRPLTVDIEKTEDYIASINRLNLFAYGDNIEEVMTELKGELKDLHNDLFNSSYKLAKPAIELKSYIEKLQE